MHSLSSKAVCCKDSLVKVLQNGGLHLCLQCFQTLESPVQRFLATAISAVPPPVSSVASFPSV